MKFFLLGFIMLVVLVVIAVDLWKTIVSGLESLRIVTEIESTHSELGVTVVWTSDELCTGPVVKDLFHERFQKKSTRFSTS
jgi:hypothetical protein